MAVQEVSVTVATIFLSYFLLLPSGSEVHGHDLLRVVDTFHASYGTNGNVCVYTPDVRPEPAAVIDGATVGSALLMMIDRFLRRL